jgi:anaerobic dimethyl sulfoxide reductase subunit A
VRIHTQLATIPLFAARDDRTVWLHPADAAARGIGDGDEVEVRSAQGRLRRPCRVTEDVAQGVVSLLAGIGPRFDESGCETEGSANVLTSAEPTLPGRGARLHSTLVEVTRPGP